MNNEKRDIPALISEGVMFEGRISSAGLLRVEGTLVGEIDDTVSLVVGETGRIEGNARADSIIIYGAVQGNLSATSITLKKTAAVTGGLRTGRLVIERGATYTGDLVMNP
ncbi:MAG TPA: polymer-forming cytoskeletal protein [Sphingobacteriaceae bacterium]